MNSSIIELNRITRLTWFKSFSSNAAAEKLTKKYFNTRVTLRTSCCFQFSRYNEMFVVLLANVLEPAQCRECKRKKVNEQTAHCRLSLLFSTRLRNRKCFNLLFIFLLNSHQEKLFLSEEKSNNLNSSFFFWGFVCKGKNWVLLFVNNGN
jgi:hypothetical protein